jgi:hypothetical protein
MVRAHMASGMLILAHIPRQWKLQVDLLCTWKVSTPAKLGVPVTEIIAFGETFPELELSVLGFAD